MKCKECEVVIRSQVCATCFSRLMKVVSDLQIVVGRMMYVIGNDEISKAKLKTILDNLPEEE